MKIFQGKEDNSRMTYAVLVPCTLLVTLPVIRCLLFDTSYYHDFTSWTTRCSGKLTIEYPASVDI